MTPEPSECILQTRNLSIGYESKLILSGLNLCVKKGEQLALIGANGIGKSTLLRTLTGLQPALSGDILLHKLPLQNYSVRERAKIISYVAAAPVRHRYMTVEELVRLGRFPYSRFSGRINQQDKERIRQALELVRIRHLSQSKISEISDGENRKALIARALVQDAPIMILDEPVSFLDPENRIVILNLLKEMSREAGKTLIFSGHDIGATLRRADKIWLMKSDELIQSTPEDLISQDAFNRLFQLPGIRFDNSHLDFREDRPPLTKLLYTAETEDTLRLTAFRHLAHRLQIDAQVCSDRETSELLIRETEFILRDKSGSSLVIDNFEDLAVQLKTRLKVIPNSSDDSDLSND